jgi:lactoylglutathione lyase
MTQVKPISRRNLIALAAVAALPAVTTHAAEPNTQAQAPIAFGYTILWVKDVDLAARFYSDAFGFPIKRRQNMGSFQWLEMNTGATTLAFAGEAEIRGMFPQGFAGHNLGQVPVAAQVSFVTTDVKAAFDRAILAGAIVIKSPAQMPWGQMWAQLRDPNGVLVSIASPLA